MSSAARRTSTSPVTRVGLVGADRYVHTMMDVARRSGLSDLRLIPGSYRHESEALASAHKLVDQVDVILFAGPLPYDRARAFGELPIPSTFVPTGGSALHSALVRALSGQILDPEHASIDTLTHAEVTDAYNEVELSARAVMCKPYDSSIGPDAYLAFHRAMHSSGRTGGVITTIPSVHRALTDAGIPSLQMRPPLSSMRQSLSHAVLLGTGARFEESRIAVVIVQLPVSSLPSRSSPAQYWFKELRLALHRELLREARAMDAIVLPHDQNSFLVFTTIGSLRMATDDLTRAPFTARVAETLKVDLEVGIGLGSSTVEAETNAYGAVAKAAARAGQAAFVVGPDGMSVQLTVGDHPALAGVERAEERQVTLLRQMVEELSSTGEQRLVVDAEKVAELTGVTLRTARRTLQSLVQSGLAWPLPPARTKRVGRPPVHYQLLDERLHATSDQDSAHVPTSPLEKP